jgi:ribulose-5-phosphate 4-epimerase/fuculose-1-phosphate aldolase
MVTYRFFWIIGALSLGLLFSGLALAQAQAPQTKCGPDHAILYKKAVKLVDSAEKKLTAKYTAEAKAQLKEANSLFSVLVKECGPAQKERNLTDAEVAEEAQNNKLKEEAMVQIKELEKSYEENLKKAQQYQAQGNNELAERYARQAKGESERANLLAAKAEIYALRNQQMIFRFLGRQ